MNEEKKTLGDMIVDPHAEDPINSLIRRELGLRMLQAMRRISVPQRTAFLLTVRDGLTYDEAGKIMKISKHTVKVHVRTARKRLRQSLQDCAKEFGIKPKN